MKKMLTTGPSSPRLGDLCRSRKDGRERRGEKLSGFGGGDERLWLQPTGCALRRSTLQLKKLAGEVAVVMLLVVAIIFFPIAMGVEEEAKLAPPLATPTSDGGNAGEKTPSQHTHVDVEPDELNPIGDPFFAEETEKPVSKREEEEVAGYWKNRKESGEKFLYANENTFFYRFDALPRHAALTLARHVLQYCCGPSDFLTDLPRYLGAEGTPVEEKPTIRIAGTGLLLSELTAKSLLSCPDLRRVAWGRVTGMLRSFTLPYLPFRDTYMPWLVGKDFVESSNQRYAVDALGGGLEEEKSMAPIAAVLEMPMECFLRFVWRERFSDFSTRQLDEVEIDEKKKEFVKTGRKIGAVVPYNSNDEEVKWRLGAFRYEELLQQLAINPHGDLRKMLDDDIQQKIKDHCAWEEQHIYEGKRMKGKDQFTLRWCFFNIDRDLLFRNFLGVKIFDKEIQKQLGLSNIWHPHHHHNNDKKKKTELKLNPFFLNAMLCGLENVRVVQRDVLERSYMPDGTSLLHWLMSGKGSLRIPERVPYHGAYLPVAGSCSGEEQFAFLSKWIWLSHSKEGEVKTSSVFQKIRDFLKKKTNVVKNLFKKK